MPGRELVNKDNPQVIEIWNIVFMQYNRKADGSLEPLPMHVIDTGMGFERLVRMLQDKHSNYDTDIFQPIIKEIEAISGKKYGFTTPTGENGEGKDEQEKIDIAMRVCADHLRAVAFSIADGQLPSNAKAGYVIRRILRRAVRYAYTFLGQKQAFMYKLVNVLVEQMGAAFPELPAQQELITRVMKEEEDSFLRTLEKGINLLNGDMDELKAHGETQLDGVSAFRLFDTYGFPLDLTELICRENGYTVDAAGFDEEMKKQKERARNAAAVENGDWEVLKEGDQNFVGYDYTEYECHILRYRKVTQKKNSFYELVLIFCIVVTHEVLVAFLQNLPVAVLYGSSIAGTLFLLLHFLVEACGIYGVTILTADQLCQVERETVGIEEAECAHAIKLSLAMSLELVHIAIEEVDTLLQGAEE